MTLRLFHSCLHGKEHVSVGSKEKGLLLLFSLLSFTYFFRFALNVCQSYKIIFCTTVNVFATRLDLLMFITNNQTQRKESARNYDRRSQAHNREYFAAQAKAENLAVVLFCCFCVVLL